MKKVLIMGFEEQFSKILFNNILAHGKWHVEISNTPVKYFFDLLITSSTDFLSQFCRNILIINKESPKTDKVTWLKRPAILNNDFFCNLYETLGNVLNEKLDKLIPINNFIPTIVGIGASTGGPEALGKFFEHLQYIRQPILLTQHMPASFLPLLASQLAKLTKMTVQIAEHEMEIADANVYIAPGDYHMELVRRKICLTKNPPENFCRPAVDPMFRSIAKQFDQQCLGLIFTGMGSDGLLGSQEIVSQGGKILAQDRESSVVWGMPGAVANADICSGILNIKDMAILTHRLCELR